MDLVALAARHIVLIHLGEALLEFQGHAFAHDSDAVDSVDEGLGVRRKQVTHDDLDHASPLLSVEQMYVYCCLQAGVCQVERVEPPPRFLARYVRTENELRGD